MIRYADLFAGVGGFREGIRQAEYMACDREQQKEAVLGEDATSRVLEVTESRQSSQWRNYSYFFQCVYASEIDRHASAVYRHIWKSNGELHEGDIREQKTAEVPDFDFLTAGFPCQSFSVAGKLGGFQNARGTLFFEVARFLADKRPRHFLLENVKNLVGHNKGETFQTILGVLASIGYRVEWEVLNSTCWVPQNRERVFFVGHLRGECGRTVFPLRENDGLYSEAPGQDSVANCLDSNYWKGWLDKGQRTMVAETAYTKSNRKDSRVQLTDHVPNLDSGHSCAVAVHIAFQGGVRFYEEESPTLSTPVGGGHLPYIGKIPGGGFSNNRICGDVAPTLMGCAKGDDGHQSGISHRNPIVPVIHRTSGQSRTIKDNETGCLQAGGANVRDKVPNIALPDSCMSLDQDGYLRLTGARPRDENGKPQLLPIGYRRFRRLIPIECERLQGWPDYHTALGMYRTSELPKSQRNGHEYTLRPVSDTQRYRMTGNGVTADCVREIVKKMIRVGCFG